MGILLISFADSKGSIFTAQKCKDGHSSVNRQRIDVLFPMCTSDEIDYDIDAPAVGRLLHVFCEVLAPIVHGMGGPIWN